MSTRERTLGCLLGLSLGDAFGAPFEGGFLERSIWRSIGKTLHGKKRWTDDTQMSIDIVESYLAMGAIDSEDLARRFALSYRWSRGYGPGAAKVLRRISRGHDWRAANRSVHPQGSYGNGAAMRAPVIGLIFANRPAEMEKAIHDASCVTHAHPLAIEGARLVAEMTSAAFRSESLNSILAIGQNCITSDEFRIRFGLAGDWLTSRYEAPSRAVVRNLGNGIPAHESCVTATYLALRFIDDSFESLHRFVVSCGGDTDTIGAMSGAIWGAANGIDRLPAYWLEDLEHCDRITELAASLHLRIEQSLPFSSA